MAACRNKYLGKSTEARACLFRARWIFPPWITSGGASLLERAATGICKTRVNAARLLVNGHSPKWLEKFFTTNAE
jgi:hypothetical protein